jgi:hypothetical protein
MPNQLFDGEIKRYGAEQYEMWGIQAADDFLKRQVPLVDSIKKIAKENSLNPKQIARVAEVANNASYLTLFKQAKDKTFEFPLADTKQIIKDLNVKLEKEHPDIPVQYLQPPPQQIKVSCKTFDDFLSVGETKIAADVTNSRKQIFRKIAEYRVQTDKAKEEYMSAMFKLESLRKQAKTSLQEILLSKKASVPDLVDVFNEIIPDEKMTGMMLLQEVSDHLKKSAAVVPETLFERRPGLRVINGNHPVLGLIKNINSEENCGAQKLVVGEMFEEKIRELKKQLVSSK